MIILTMSVREVSRNTRVMGRRTRRPRRGLASSAPRREHQGVNCWARAQAQRAAVGLAPGTALSDQKLCSQIPGSSASNAFTSIAAMSSRLFATLRDLALLQAAVFARSCPEGESRAHFNTSEFSIWGPQASLHRVRPSPSACRKRPSERDLSARSPMRTITNIMPMT